MFHWDSNMSSCLYGLMFIKGTNYFQVRAICWRLAVKNVSLYVYSFLNLGCQWKCWYSESLQRVWLKYTEVHCSDAFFTADRFGYYHDINRLNVDSIILVAMIISTELLKYASNSCKSRSKQFSRKGMINYPWTVQIPKKMQLYPRKHWDRESRQMFYVCPWRTQFKTC